MEEGLASEVIFAILLFLMPPDNADRLGLQTLDQAGNPPLFRVKDCSTLNSIYSRFFNDDRQAAADRACLQAMLDGEPPFKEAELVANNQAYRCNLNWGEAAAIEETALSSYYDMVHSVDYLAEMILDPEYGTDVERAEWARVIAEEFHRLHMENWPAYDFTRQLLYRAFVSYGVGIAFFEDDVDWKWHIAGLNEIKLPRNATPDVSTWDILFIDRTFQVSELYHAIQDEVAATCAGWNVPVVKKVLIDQMGDDKIRTWEDFQVYAKNNDLGASYAGKSGDVKAAHSLVAEFDKSVTHYITLQNGSNSDYLFKRANRYKCMSDAIVLFTFGVGNGYVHGIRGLAYKIFNFIQMVNQMRCQMVDSAQIASVIMLQPNQGTDATLASLSFVGPFSVLPPGMTVVQTNMPNTSTQMLPVVNDMLMTLQNNVGMYRTRATMQNGQERTKFEVQAQLSQETILSSSSMNLFYGPLKKLYTLQVNRLTNPDCLEADPKNKDAFLFRRRCAQRGVPLDALTKIISVEPMRAVGSGSPAARLLALDRMQSLIPFMDDAGKLSYARDVAAATVGQTQVNRYLPAINLESRPPVDAKIAELENSDLRQGVVLAVFPSEMHAIHARIHAQDLVQALQVISSGQFDIASALTHIQASAEHLGMHLAYLAQGGNIWGDLVGQITQLLQQTNEVSVNLQKQLQAQQQQEMIALQQHAQAQQQQGTPVDPTVEAKMRLLQLQIAEREQKLKQDQEKHQARMMQVRQKMGLNDARVAQDLALSAARQIGETGGR